MTNILSRLQLTSAAKRFFLHDNDWLICDSVLWLQGKENREWHFLTMIPQFTRVTAPYN